MSAIAARHAAPISQAPFVGGERTDDDSCSELSPRNPVVQLYRTISKELPRVLTIYDADVAPADVSPPTWDRGEGRKSL